MPIWLQDVVVLIVALVAAAVVVRRVFGAFTPRPQKPACDSCELARAVDTTTARKA